MKKLLLISLLLSGSLIAQSIMQNYNVVRKINADAKRVGEYTFVEYSVKSSDGKELYQIVDKVDHDIPYSKLEVFEDGNSVLINAFYGRLTFITNNGGEVRSIKIKDDLKVEYERNILSVVDNNSLLLLFRDLNDNYSTIQKYNEKGNLEKEFRIMITGVNGLAFSENLNQIYVSHIIWENSGKLNKKVTLLNTIGELVNNFNANFEKGFFTEDNQFVAYSNKSILSFDTVNLVLNYFEKYETDEVILDVTYLNKETLVALAKSPELNSGEWYFKDPIIKKIDSNGDLIEQTRYERNVFSECKFRMAQSNLIFVTGQEEIIIE